MVSMHLKFTKSWKSPCASKCCFIFFFSSGKILVHILLFSSVFLVVQWVVFPPHISRVLGLILSSGSCLYWVSHVLPTSVWVSSQKHAGKCTGYVKGVNMWWTEYSHLTSNVHGISGSTTVNEAEWMTGPMCLAWWFTFMLVCLWSVTSVNKRLSWNEHVSVNHIHINIGKEKEHDPSFSSSEVDSLAAVVIR